ncbi:hypothetical protein ASC99_20950 [Kitasatospora sp. Root107]|nr:hypothetical protein ASC99_20950 [Kitasatospora sp. Root107]
MHQRAYRFTGSLYDAQDLVQELFLGLWGKRETLGEIDNPSGYLFRALTNRFIDSRRRAKVRPVEADLDLLLGFEPTSEDSNPKLDLLESGVIKALLGLTDKQRAMVVLVDIEGYLRAEAARELRVSYSSACRHYEIAHEKLREIVELPEGMVKEGQHELE